MNGISYVNVWKTPNDGPLIEAARHHDPKICNYLATIYHSTIFYKGFLRIEMRFNGHWFRPPVGFSGDSK